MNSPTNKPPLSDITVDVKLKLSALWAAVTLSYLYGDYFGLYKPGALTSMIEGRMGPLGSTTQNVLLGVAAMMAVPCLMVCLSLVLAPPINRLANILCGLAFTIIMLLTMPGGWLFYQFLGVLEIGLTSAIVWHAWRWPRPPANS